MGILYNQRARVDGASLLLITHSQERLVILPLHMLILTDIPPV